MTTTLRGVFTWDAEERRTQRYGYVYFTKDEPGIVHDFCMGLHHQRVKIWCRVLETRKSHHIGDQFLDIFPSEPEVGQEFVLGIGTLDIEPSDFAIHGLSFGVLPDDNRDFFWYDPRTLYKLHDQTVEVFIDPVPEDTAPLPISDLKPTDIGFKYVTNSGIQVVTCDLENHGSILVFGVSHA